MRTRLLYTLAIVALFACSHSRQQQSLTSETIALGSPVPSLIVRDQFENEYVLGKKAQAIVLAFDMDAAKAANSQLESQPTFLNTHRLQYVSDISPMPKVISAMFAKPKMRKYPFTILLIEDESTHELFPRQEGKLTLLKLAADSSVQEIRFIDSILQAGQ